MRRSRHPSGSCSIRSAGGSTGPIRSGSTIGWAKLDGTGGGTLNTTGTTVNKPSALTVNPATRTLYWINDNANQRPLLRAAGRQRRRRSGRPQLDDRGQRRHRHDVRSGQPALLLGRPRNRGCKGYIGYETLGCRPAGAGFLDTGTVATLNYPFAIAYNNGDGFAYWTNDNGKIGGVRTDIAGLGSENLNTTGATTTSNPGGVPLNLAGIAIDERHFRVYWGGSWNGWHEQDLLRAAGQQRRRGRRHDRSDGLAARRRGVARRTGPGLSPTVAGTPVTGSTLTCDQGSWQPDDTAAFYWRSPSSYSYAWALERRRDQQPDRLQADARQGGPLHLHDHGQQRGRQRVEHQQAGEGDRVQLARWRGSDGSRRRQERRRTRFEQPAGARARPDPPDAPHLGQPPLPGPAGVAKPPPYGTAFTTTVNRAATLAYSFAALATRPHRQAPLREADRSQPRRARLHPAGRARPRSSASPRARARSS